MKMKRDEEGLKEIAVVVAAAGIVVMTVTTVAMAVWMGRIGCSRRDCGGKRCL